MHKLITKLKDLLLYDADREFYAKVFPGTVERKNLMKVRYMEYSDLGAIVAIEGKNYNFPWSENVFKDCLRATNYQCWVCDEPDDKVIGYCIVSVGADEAHIMNLCVDPEHHRLGAGRKMLEHMIDRVRSKADRIFLEVRPSNVKAINLYKSLGFNQIGMRKEYYPALDGREDAVVLALELVEML